MSSQCHHLGVCVSDHGLAFLSSFLPQALHSPWRSMMGFFFFCVHATLQLKDSGRKRKTELHYFGGGRTCKPSFSRPVPSRPPGSKASPTLFLAEGWQSSILGGVRVHCGASHQTASELFPNTLFILSLRSPSFPPILFWDRFEK